MGEISSIHLQRLQGRLGDIVCQLTKMQYGSFSPPNTWAPAVNAYRCDGLISLCVDLAGVDKEAIDLRVEPKRIVLTGRRLAPDPAACGQKPLRVMIMEIDHGPFRREILLDEEVEVSGVTATQNDGLLWITLPLRAQA